jgi:hypothetical protein
MKKLLMLFAFFCTALSAQQPATTEEITKRLNRGGEYLSKAGTSFGSGLGVAVVGYGATLLTSRYGKNSTTPIVIASITTTISLSCTVAGVVRLVKGGRALRGWSFASDTPKEDFNRYDPDAPKKKIKWF